MYEIHDRHSDESHKGRGWDSIARRVWGRSAVVKNARAVEPGSDVFFAEIVKPMKGEGGSMQRYEILASVILMGDN